MLQYVILVVLNPNCYVKCDWDWGEVGHFTFYARELFTQFDFEALYNYDSSQNKYQYGFKIEATDFLDLTRKVLWETENGIVPRIWFLGDNGFPGNWDVWLLWNYEWYEVK